MLAWRASAGAGLVVGNRKRERPMPSLIPDFTTLERRRRLFAYRYSIRTVCPTSYPACFNARWMAATGPDGASADEEARKPTTGIVMAGLLRARRERQPHRRAAEQRDEVAPFHD